MALPGLVSWPRSDSQGECRLPTSQLSRLARLATDSWQTASRRSYKQTAWFVSSPTPELQREQKEYQAADAQGHALHSPDRERSSGLTAPWGLPPTLKSRHGEVQHPYATQGVQLTKPQETRLTVGRQRERSAVVEGSLLPRAYLPSHLVPKYGCQATPSPESCVVRTKPPTAAAAPHPMPVPAGSIAAPPTGSEERAGRELAQGSEAATSTVQWGSV